nr:hypothetical protein [Lachnospiraceae bacterium]
MRKTFILIGILLAIFSIYMIAIDESYNIYLNDECVYDFSTEKEIEIAKLSEIAKECNVSPQIRQYNFSTILRRDITIYVINPTDKIKEGIKKNIIPTIKVNIILDDIDTTDYISNFIVQTNNEKSIEKFSDLLKEYGGTIYSSYSLELNSIGLLCNELNGKFFVSLFSLALFCTISFYGLRTKEIGVLKLNGWDNINLSLRMLKSILFRTTVPYLCLILMFGIYI